MREDRRYSEDARKRLGAGRLFPREVSVAGGSFWEKLGRGVGYGLRKAREVGAQLGEHAELKLALREARERLARAHEALSLLVVERAGGEGGTLDPADPELGARIARVREDQEEVALLERELEDRRREAEARAAGAPPAAGEAAPAGSAEGEPRGPEAARGAGGEAPAGSPGAPPAAGGGSGGAGGESGGTGRGSGGAEGAAGRRGDDVIQ